MSALPRGESAFEGDSKSPFYFNTSHWNAVDGILEGVNERSGLMVLTGPTGSGKTMLMRAISDQLKEETPPLFLNYASLNFREFVNFLHKGMKIGDEVKEASNKAVALREYLYIQAKRGETAVIFIDEAHNLEPDVLRMLPKLARFDTLDDGRPVGLQFVLVGNSELRELMEDPDFDILRAKINRSYELRFFSREELSEFLKKRLAPIARNSDEPITADGIDAIERYTGGSPGLIGRICSHAMLFAAENPGRSIDGAMVREAADALMIKEVETPFAHESDMQQQAEGPYSAADLDKSTVEPRADDKPASAPEDVYPAAVDTSEPYSLDVPLTAPRPPVLGEEVAGDPEERASLHNFFSEDAEIDLPAPATQAEFDPSALGRAVDMGEGRVTDDEDDYYDDDLYDDDDTDFDDDDDDELEASDSKKSGAFSGLLTRFSGGKKNTELGKVVGASRRKDLPAESAEKRTKAKSKQPRTVVAGQRAKQLKMAAAGVGAIALIGGVYMISQPLLGALGGLKQAVAGHSIGGAEPVDVAPTVPTMQANLSTDPGLQAPLGFDAPAPVAPAAPAQSSFGGWGARVAVSADAPAVPAQPVLAAPSYQQAAVAPTAQQGEPEEAAPAGIKVPKQVTDVAAAALGAVEGLFARGSSSSKDDSVATMLDAASEQLGEMRVGLIVGAKTPEEAKVYSSELAAKGDAYFKARRLIGAGEDNSYQSYRKALQYNPENEAAREGIRQLRTFYATKADGARDAHQWEKANKLYETAIAISELKSLPGL